MPNLVQNLFTSPLFHKIPKQVLNDVYLLSLKKDLSLDKNFYMLLFGQGGVCPEGSQPLQVANDTLA